MENYRLDSELDAKIFPSNSIETMRILTSADVSDDVVLVVVVVVDAVASDFGARMTK